MEDKFAHYVIAQIIFLAIWSFTKKGRIALMIAIAFAGLKEVSDYYALLKLGDFELMDFVSSVGGLLVVYAVTVQEP